MDKRRYQVHWGEPAKGHPRNSYVVLDTAERKELLVTQTKGEATKLADELNEQEE